MSLEKYLRGDECGYAGGQTWCDRSYARCVTLAATATFWRFSGIYQVLKIKKYGGGRTRQKGKQRDKMKKWDWRTTNKYTGIDFKTKRYIERGRFQLSFYVS